MDDDVPVRYVMERFREVQVAVAQLDQKIDDKLGDFAVRLAKIELRQEQTDKVLDRATDGRRWLIGTVIAALALLIAIAAVVVAIAKGGGT